MKSLLFRSVFLLPLILPAAVLAQTDKDIVHVNGTPIRQSEVVERLWQRYGPATLDEMIDEVLLRQAAKAAGVKPEASEVDRRLARIKEQFGDPAMFQNQLEQAGSSVEKLRADIADQVAIAELVIAARKITLSDAELRKVFEARKAKLASPPAVHLRHILVAAPKDAEDIIAQVKGGADFTKLARERSLAPTGKLKGGDYGFVTKGLLPAEVDEIAFAMKPGELRSVRSPKGVHILQALERRPSKPAEFLKIKTDLRDMILAERIKDALPGYLQELRAKADIKPQGQ